MTQDGRDYPGGPLVVSDLAAADIGCDLDGYPVRETAVGGRNDHLVQSCVQLAPQHWDDLTKYAPSPSARVMSQGQGSNGLNAQTQYPGKNQMNSWGDSPLERSHAAQGSIHVSQLGRQGFHGNIHNASDLARIAILEAENAVLKAHPWMYVTPDDPTPRPVLHDPRIVALEAENTHLRSLLNRIAPERLSVGWEHLPDVAAPAVRMIPARALRGGDGVPR